MSDPQHGGAGAGVPATSSPLSHLRVFATVASELSIAKAAEIVCRTPSAVSRQVLELEEHFGVALLERSRRGVLLTAHGKALFERSRRIESLVRQAADDYASVQSITAGRAWNALAGIMYSARKLALLVHLARMLSISASAEQLGMSQPGVSMALSRIETVLGCTLFERTASGLTPSRLAERLVLAARLVLSELRHLEADVSGASGDIAGSVVIGTGLIGRIFVVPNAVAAIVDRYPRVRMSIIDEPYRNLLEKLRGGDVDFVFSSLEPSALVPEFSVEQIFSDSVGVFARSGHPLAGRRGVELAELPSYRWILPRPEVYARQMLEAKFREARLPAPVAAVETSDLVVIRQLLSVSDLVTIGSPHQLLFEIRAGSVVKLDVHLEGSSRFVGVTTRKDALLSGAGREVLDAVRVQAHSSAQLMLAQGGGNPGPPGAIVRVPHQLP